MKFFVPVVAAFGLALAAPAVAQDAPASPPSNPAAPTNATPPAPPTDTQPAPTPSPAPTPDAAPPAPAPAMDATPPAPPSAPAPSDSGMAASTGASGGPLPTCSATVRDRCQQPAAAERMAAEVYKGGGHDNSAMMHGRTKTAHKRHKAA